MKFNGMNESIFALSIFLALAGLNMLYLLTEKAESYVSSSDNFLIPSETLEGSYVPVMQWAYSSKHWVGTLSSEILLSLGSLSLFSIFILMAAFWAHMLRRVDVNNSNNSYQYTSLLFLTSNHLSKY